MTTDSYKTLFASSVVFGIKKQLRAEQGIPALEAQVAELEGMWHFHLKVIRYHSRWDHFCIRDSFL